MNIYKGTTGLDKTWQEKFEPKIECRSCGGGAEIMFTAIENERSDDFVCDLHETTGKKGGLWLHDACAVAVYLCRDCFEASAIVNQA